MIPAVISSAFFSSIAAPTAATATAFVAIAPERDVKENIQYRIAFDLGSGTLKIQAAWVDPLNGRIAEMAYQSKINIPVGEALARDPEGKIPEEIVQQLIDALREFKEKTPKEIDIAGCIGTATEAFRRAANGIEVVQRIEEAAGVKIFILSPEEEAILGQRALEAEGLLPNEPFIVWENGGGSMQISSKTKDGIEFYGIPIGKVSMKNHIIGQQGNDFRETNSPNPVSPELAEEAKNWVKKSLENFPDWLKAKLREKNLEVVGFSGMFSTATRVLKRKEFTIDDVQTLLNRFVGKTDRELIDFGYSGEDALFAVSDLLFLHSVMTELEIQKVRFTKTEGPGSTSGLLIDPKLWSELDGPKNSVAIEPYELKYSKV